jgi:hypothetical protein
MNKRNLIVILTLLAVVAVFSACGVRVVRGSGSLVTETRPVSDFERIVLSGSGEVIVTQGGSESLSIETDDNIMEHLITEVKNGTLTLGFEPGVNIVSPTELVFSVGVDDLSAMVISGSGEIQADGLDTDRLEVDISGSGDVRVADLSASEVTVDISGSGNLNLTGEASSQDITVSGSGKYQAGEVCSAAVRVLISGSGDATLCATETLDSTISGSGSVRYYGQPAINSSVSGSGTIQSLGER